jgi:hypothetical protein
MIVKQVQNQAHFSCVLHFVTVLSTTEGAKRRKMNETEIINEELTEEVTNMLTFNKGPDEVDGSLMTELGHRVGVFRFVCL